MKTIDGLPLPDAILIMAIQTFVELGYEKASMDEVATRASTTKRTVYAHYGNKEGLFRAALARAVELFLSELPALDDISDPSAELERFANRFSDLCTWRRAVRLQRVVMAEAERFPDLGAMLHREVIEAAEHLVAAYLDRLAKAGQPAAGVTGDSNRLASIFLNMTTGRQRFATLLEARHPPENHPDAETPPDVDGAAIRQAVAMFLTASGLADR